MPHHKSAKKRVLTNEVRRQRNIARRSRMRSILKEVRTGLDSGQLKGEEALKAVTNATSYVQRMVGKGLIHRNQAARLKSRLDGRLQG